MFLVAWGSRGAGILSSFCKWETEASRRVFAGVWCATHTTCPKQPSSFTDISWLVSSLRLEDQTGYSELEGIIWAAQTRSSQRENHSKETLTLCQRPRLGVQLSNLAQGGDGLFFSITKLSPTHSVKSQMSYTDQNLAVPSQLESSAALSCPLHYWAPTLRCVPCLVKVVPGIVSAFRRTRP